MNRRMMFFAISLVGLCACSRTSDNSLAAKDMETTTVIEATSIENAKIESTLSVETDDKNDLFKDCEIIKDDKTGKIKEATNNKNAKKTVECHLDKEKEDELVLAGEKLAKENVDFTFDTNVEFKKEYNMSYSVIVTEKDENGFTTANVASILFNGDGELYYAIFSRDECEYKEEDFIDTENAYNKAIDSILAKYPDFKNYSLKGGALNIEKMRRDGSYKYIIPIKGDLDNLNGIEAFFSVSINAVTGECMELASNLN